VSCRRVRFQPGRPPDRVVAFGGSKPTPFNRATMYLIDDRDPAKFYSHEELFMASRTAQQGGYHPMGRGLGARRTLLATPERACRGTRRMCVSARRPVTTSPCRTARRPSCTIWPSATWWPQPPWARMTMCRCDPGADPHRAARTAKGWDGVDPKHGGNGIVSSAGRASSC
jgi:hypothetical protein